MTSNRAIARRKLREILQLAGASVGIARVAGLDSPGTGTDADTRAAGGA
jgi:hypothetical protein